jgi:hypothetical protein
MDRNGITFGNSMTEDTECQRSNPSERPQTLADSLKVGALTPHPSAYFLLI